MAIKQIELPDHVVAAFGDADTARDWALAAVTDEARKRAVAVAYDEVQSALAEAAAPFADGAQAPETPTPLEVIAQTAADQAALREQVRTIGVALASAAGVPEEQAQAMIDAALTAPVDVPAEPAPAE